MAEISLQEYCEQIDNTIEQGRYAEAVAHGKHILKSYPKHTATYRLLGKAMLEAGQDEYATNMFRRTLSADPEDLVAWVGMSEVYSRRGELDAAIWCLEQAFALATDNQVLEEELRHLYSRRDGVEPQRIQLTHGALARLYLRGDLLSRAIAEFRALLVKHPERVDLNVALAEALWRNEQRLEASEVCQQVLNELPYSLKANLLLGEIWTSSGREEGQVYLRQAEALDPDNQMAQEIFGTRSPLPKRQVRITPLEYKHPTEKERPAWMTEVEAASEEPPLSEREATLVDITAALEARIEIPTWLEEIVDDETAEPVPPSITEPSAEQPPEEVVSAPAEEIPEWLADTYEESIEEKAKAIAEEKTTEWPAEESLEIISPDKVPAAPGEVKIPDWLTELGIEAADED
ncbi:MAG: tetratricopeptide repeat protein, partial [Chloroflexota bacterium]|nr:tetratricopeptide repeat protein [Chloroflexota bacterium]